MSFQESIGDRVLCQRADRDQFYGLCGWLRADRDQFCVPPVARAMVHMTVRKDSFVDTWLCLHLQLKLPFP